MTEKSEKLLTAGEFAKLHGINKRTVMYYDDIGLLHPIKRGENGYRFYSYLQGFTLEILLSLRELDVSIDEIKQYMKSRTPEALFNLLNLKISEAENKIERLTAIKQILLHKKNMLEEYSHTNNKFSLITLPDEYFYIKKLDPDITDEDTVKAIFEYITTSQKYRLYSVSAGFMSSIENLPANDYFYIQADSPEPLPEKDLHIRPAGQYLRAYHTGHWLTISETYQEVIEYAEKHKLKLTGYIYETEVIDDMATKIPDNYVTQLLIRCE